MNIIIPFPPFPYHSRIASRGGFGFSLPSYTNTLNFTETILIRFQFPNTTIILSPFFPLPFSVPLSFFLLSFGHPHNHTPKHLQNHPNLTQFNHQNPTTHHPFLPSIFGLPFPHTQTHLNFHQNHPKSTPNLQHINLVTSPSSPFLIRPHSPPSLSCSATSPTHTKLLRNQPKSTLINLNSIIYQDRKDSETLPRSFPLQPSRFLSFPGANGSPNAPTHTWEA